MLPGFARQLKLLSLQKAGCQAGLASLLLLMGAGTVHDAAALNETRTLSFHHTHSGEDLTVTFKRDGRYDEEALKRLSHLLRDWRTQDEIVMDRHLFDIVWEVYRDVDGKEPIQIVSAYRSPATNAMLRRRSAHSGVARFSQHMLGHAMDFYIPNVPLEQIRYAGLRLQRGGVGFYPSSGSPFVHLDSGNVRHWPRMTHDQLVRVFPDGRTVHIPSDGVPLKGYELAKADIDRRGNGDDAATIGKPSLFAALFRIKSTDEDEDAASVAVANDKPAAAIAATKPADAVPTPRARPQVASTLQLAAADTQIVQLAKPKLPAPASTDKAAAKPSNDKPQTPADIINARGFWGDDPATPQQATPAQVLAAISARKARDSADPQSSATGAVAYHALAYAQAPSRPADHANIVAASAPIPQNTGASMQARNSALATGVNSVATKGVQGTNGPITNSARIAAANGDSAWLRIMMLAPSVGTSMSVTMLGNPDLTLMRGFFVKPQAAITMSFTDDPMMGMAYDHFSGSATTKLDITSFVVHTAALR